MSKQHSIIQVNQDGVEFYTLPTGESGMSVSGLAIVCGVSQPAISQLLSNLISKSPSKWLNHLVGKDLNLTTNGVKKGGRSRVLRSDVCAAIIRHYAFNGLEKAQDFLAQLEDKALEMFIQSVTGWEPPSIGRQFADKHILREPRRWEVMFDRGWIRAAEDCTGRKWSDPCMSQVINLLVYDRFPKEVKEALDEYNPALDNGFRGRKQHQFFSEEALNTVLRAQIEMARSLLLVSTSWQELQENTRRHFEGLYQLNLLP